MPAIDTPQFRLSASALNTFRESPREFWLQKIKRVARPRGIFPGLPGGIDRMLKGHYDQHRAKGTVPGELILPEPGLRLYDGARPPMQKWRHWQSAPKWTDPQTGCTLIGALDDLLVDSIGRLYPLDYKTAGARPEPGKSARYYGLQGSCYGLMIEAAGHAVGDSCVFAYYTPAEVSDYKPGGVLLDFDVTPQTTPIDTAGAADIFRAAVACLRGPLPAAGPSDEWDSWALRYAEEIAIELAARRAVPVVHAAAEG